MKKAFLKSSLIALIASLSAVGGAFAGDDVTNQMLTHHNTAIFNDSLSDNSAVVREISSADNISDTSKGHHNAAIFEPSYMVLDLSDDADAYKATGDDISNQRSAHHNASIFNDTPALTQ